MKLKKIYLKNKKDLELKKNNILIIINILNLNKEIKGKNKIKNNILKLNLLNKFNLNNLTYSIFFNDLNNFFNYYNKVIKNDIYLKLSLLIIKKNYICIKFFIKYYNLFNIDNNNKKYNLLFNLILKNKYKFLYLLKNK